MKNYSSDERTQILTDWCSSGLSGKAFSLRSGVSTATLYQWRKQHAAAPAPVFRPVIVRDVDPTPPPHANAAIESGVVAEIARDGVVVRIHAGIAPNTLASIMTLVLGGSAC